MAARQMERRPRWRPPFSEWFEDLPLDPRTADQHVIRVEESKEDGAFTVRAELPGVDPDKDIDITVDDGLLTVRAERTEEKKDKQHSEFRYGSFTRSVQLPQDVDEEAITATYDKGVLTVTAPLPAVAPSEPHHVQITRR